MAKTDTDIQELKSFIGEQFGQVNKRLESIEKDINDLKISVTRLDATVGGLSDRTKTVEATLTKLPEITEKFGELKNWRQIALVVIAGSISAIFGWLLRGGKF
jgi:archaellum component FlaC